MALEILLEKAEGDAWGFRLTGGVEYDVPLTIVKVNEGSVAEKCGLETNDVIIRINDDNTTQLTHLEAHNLLISSGNFLRFGILRGESSLSDIEASEEVSQITQIVEEQRVEHEQINEVHFEVVKENGSVISSELQELVQLEDAKKLEEKNLERKWSTFLQKPKNAKPKVKQNEELVKDQPYRVVIKKQKKKESKKIAQDVHVEEKIEEVKEEVFEETLENVGLPNEETEQLCEKIEDEEKEPNSEHKEDNYLVVEPREEPIERSRSYSAPSIANQILEEKLAEVQRQLAALSILPLTIQSTIDAVTRQLATIISTKTETFTSENEEIFPQEVISSEDEITERNITDDECDSVTKDLEAIEEEDLDQIILQEDENFEIEGVEEEVVDNVTNIVKEVEEVILTEEELEAKKQEEKKQKDLEQLEELKQSRLIQRPTLPLTPAERPIVLPGGRRWSQPDDASRNTRQPKMSDEKIANTIETYSEVIVGRTKGLTIGTNPGPGLISQSRFTESNCPEVPSKAAACKRINFLKYQPPPKNMAYLQQSDVFKLVHDMDPPIRGICSRGPKIVAEQDYYQVQ